MEVKFKKKHSYKTRNWKRGDVKNIDRGLALQLEKEGVVTILKNKAELKTGINEEEYKSPLKPNEEEE